MRVAGACTKGESCLRHVIDLGDLTRDAALSSVVATRIRVRVLDGIRVLDSIRVLDGIRVRLVSRHVCAHIL